MENATPRFERVHNGSLREGTATGEDRHDTNRSSSSLGGIHRTPIFDVPGTATSGGSSVASSTLTLPRSVTSGKGRDAIINEYYDETKLLTVIETWIKQLIHQEELPYNPYPGLVWQARRCAERFGMFGEDSRTVSEKIENQVFSIGSLASRTQDSPARWGLATTLRVVNTEALTAFDWLLSSMNADVTTDDSEDYSYIIQKPFPVLCGRCVFVGTLYPVNSEESIDIRMEYAISGPEETRAAETFSKAVLSDILMMNDAEVHIVLGVSIPVEDVRHRGHWVREVWTCQNITEIQEQFLNLLKSAAVAQKMAEALCMFRLQPESRLYRKGRKQYNLNFIKTEGGRSTSVSSYPYQSAYEGVFTSSFHIKEYLSWFASGEQGQEPSLIPPATTSRTQTQRTGRSRSNRHSSNTQLRSSAVTMATSQAGSSRASHGDLNNPTVGPYSEQSLSAIKSYLSDRILEFVDEVDFFKMLHFVILVVLLNREDTDAQESLVEAYRLLKSTAYQLYHVMQQNHVLQDLVSFFASHGMGASDVVQAHFLAYRHSLEDFFSNSLRERSREMLVYGKVLLKTLDAMTVINPHLEGTSRTGTLPLTIEVNRGLEVINRYCETVFLGLIDDALPCCSFIVKYFPPVKNGNSLIVQQSFKHGAERGDIINQENLALVVAEQAKTVAAPPAIAKETVLLQYLVDSKLDQVFHEFLVDLVTEEEFIPANPYPRLTTDLTVASMRMELFGEKPAKLLSKIVSPVQLTDPENFVCHIPGIEAYGLPSAIAVLDGKHYNNLRARLHSLANKVNTRITVAGFSTVVDMALCGFAPLYGLMTPYLHEIDLEEHYFIQGPSHSRTEVIVHFAKLVYDHLVDFSEKEDVLFLGFFLGGETLRRSLHDIIPPQRKKAFMSQLISTVVSKQPLFLRVYVALDWRLVMVKKSFCFHFLPGQDNGYERFYNASSDPLAFYQIVFSKQDVALSYARCCGPQDLTDPCKGENLMLSLVHVDHYIERAKEEEDLISVYRWLMVKSLMSQHKSYLVEAWRMFHSVASQLEYLRTLNKTLQSLVNEELSKTFRPLLDGDERTSLLDVATLNTMTTAYGNKLELVLSRGTALTPSGLLPRLREKFRQATLRDPVSRTLTLVISSKTPIILQEINEMLQPLMDAAAHNVHLACPEVQRAMKSVEVDVSGRKSSLLAKSRS